VCIFSVAQPAKAEFDELQREIDICESQQAALQKFLAVCTQEIADTLAKVKDADKMVASNPTSYWMETAQSRCRKELLLRQQQDKALDNIQRLSCSIERKRTEQRMLRGQAPRVRVQPGLCVCLSTFLISNQSMTTVLLQSD
jgi:mannose/fructose/N-acetylgalactosamine-specific phosphotransferase system component IIB